MKSEPVIGVTRSRPSGALRLAFRLPVHLYKFRLGWLLGHRVLLLTHQGRKSGRVHGTVLEVVRYDPVTKETVVVSAWGENADWYRNIQANPAMEIRIGREHYVPEQRFLSEDEAYAEIAAYEHRYPRWLIRAGTHWLGHPLDGTQEARRSFVDVVPMVAFRPKREAQ